MLLRFWTREPEARNQLMSLRLHFLSHPFLRRRERWLSGKSSIPKKKRKMAIRELRQASLAEEDQEEATTSLVTREILKKRAEEAATEFQKLKCIKQVDSKALRIF